MRPGGQSNVKGSQMATFGVEEDIRKEIARDMQGLLGRGSDTARTSRASKGPENRVSLMENRRRVPLCGAIASLAPEFESCFWSMIW